MLFLFLVFALSAAPACATLPDSLDLKIGQMIMIGIGERTSQECGDSLCRELSAGAIGGVVLFEKNLSKTNTSDSLKQLIKAVRQYSKTPLFISVDEEGGRVHRLKEKYGFFALPTASYLGRINNRDSTLYYNRKLAALLRDLGFNLNYAPSADMAVNLENTLIVKTERSFGQQAGLVAIHAAACMQAHREYNRDSSETFSRPRKLHQ